MHLVVDTFACGNRRNGVKKRDRQRGLNAALSLRYRRAGAGLGVALGVAFAGASGGAGRRVGGAMIGASGVAGTGGRVGARGLISPYMYAFIATASGLPTTATETATLPAAWGGTTAVRDMPSPATTTSVAGVSPNRTIGTVPTPPKRLPVIVTRFPPQSGRSRGRRP